MDSGVLGLGAVAWTEAWTAAAPEAGLRLPVDPTRLLAVLRGLPIARGLLSELQQAESAGRSVELIVSPDRQMARIAIGSSRYVLTPAARDSVLAAFLGRFQDPPKSGGAAPTVGDPSNSTGLGRPAASSGVLWEPPTAAPREPEPVWAEAIALPWLGAEAQLQIRRDGAGSQPGAEAGSTIHHATLRLQLPQLGYLAAAIRLCGHTVAVSIDCSSALCEEAQLEALRQRLSSQGLTTAHVGLSTTRTRS